VLGIFEVSLQGYMDRWSDAETCDSTAARANHSLGWHTGKRCNSWEERKIKLENRSPVDLEDLSEAFDQTLRTLRKIVPSSTEAEPETGFRGRYLLKKTSGRN
jgi:hypothetical protein